MCNHDRFQIEADRLIAIAHFERLEKSAPIIVAFSQAALPLKTNVALPEAPFLTEARLNDIWEAIAPAFVESSRIFEMNFKDDPATIHIQDRGSLKYKKLQTLSPEIPFSITVIDTDIPGQLRVGTPKIPGWFVGISAVKAVEALGVFYRQASMRNQQESSILPTRYRPKNGSAQPTR